MWNFFKKKRPTFKESPVYFQNACRLAIQIENLCDEKMEEVHPKLRIHKTPVIISYGELLDIWNKANLIRNAI
tara:strand:- start:1047 stop:1265 length:219 start_codon:yes stop_codon:yes gene_type:complete